MKKKIHAGKAAGMIILAVLGLMFIIPFIYMISISLASPKTNSLARFTIIPREFHFYNFVEVFKNQYMLGWVSTSVIMTGANVLLTVLSSSLFAYAFARLRARGKNIIFMILLSTMMIPTQVTLIPRFVLFKKLGWINTLLPLIVPNCFGVPLYVFMLRQFIMRIPLSMDEAARMDGLGYFGIYHRIVLPLIKPALATVAILSAVNNWGWYFEPKIYLNKTEKYPLAVGVQILSATGGVGEAQQWHIAFAASMLLVIPMVLLYYFGQKYIYDYSSGIGSEGIK